jgi:SAM-dependent methyltransferase
VQTHSTLLPSDTWRSAADNFATPSCRSCGTRLERTFADLGEMPLANAYLTAEQLAQDCEQRWSLHARVCDRCLLVQVNHEVTANQLFDDYAYFSSYSSSWLDHCRTFADHTTTRLGLGGDNRVVEIASNDGYLLQFFQQRGVRVLGIEPAANVAAVATARSIPTEVTFFSADCARTIVRRDGTADLVVANNVLAHVPDLHDVLDGLRILIGRSGVASIEVPHLLELVRHLQFDTIYHEHFSYFSLLALLPLMQQHDMGIFDVEQLATHGGSVRLWIAAPGTSPWNGTARVADVVCQERRAGLDRPERYDGFAADVERVIDGFGDFLHGERRDGQRVAAYGAAAKGNTFLNACGLTGRDIEFVADLSPAKQGRFLPGSHIPVVEPGLIDIERPDLIVILPWNLRAEITAQLQHIANWGGRFVTAIPQVEVGR